MHLVDTHNHIYLPEFDADRDEVMTRAAAAGVIRVLLPAIDSSSYSVMMEAAERYSTLCCPMIGLHPTSVKENYISELDFVNEKISGNTFYGIGETGIDLYWDKTFLKEQIVSFREHLSLAEKYNLPVVIHARESLQLIFEEIEKFGTGKVTGVFHAFQIGRAHV